MTPAAGRSTGGTDQQPPNSSSFPLPPEVLLHMFWCMDTPQLLSTCALVNRTWRRTAAAAAATSIRATISKDKPHAAIAGLHDWLVSHAEQVADISLACSQPTSRFNYKPSVRLPFQQLQQLRSLHLRDLNLLGFDAGTPDQGSSDSDSDTDSDADSYALEGNYYRDQYGARLYFYRGRAPPSNPLAPLAASLTSLSLERVLLFGSGFDRLSSLSVLTALQQLKLDGVEDGPTCLHWLAKRGVAGASQFRDKLYIPIPATTLGCLTNLTSVQLGLEDSRREQFAVVCSLPKLRDLSFAFPYRYTTAVFEANLNQLPVSLASLQLRGFRDALSDYCRISPGSATRLAQLTQLRQLQLCNVGCCCKPDILSGVLQQLPELLHFELAYDADVGRERGQFSNVFDRAHCQALASCTGLTHLALTNVAFQDYCRTPNVQRKNWFLADCSCPRLQILRFCFTDRIAGSCSWSWLSNQSHDLLLVGERCPVLRQLDVTGAVAGLQCGDEEDEDDPGWCWRSLLQLTSLTVGDVGDDYLEDEVPEITDQVLDGVAELVQLRELCLNTCYVTWAGSRVLTALTALTRLYVSSNGKDELELTSSASPPDVWRQLRTLCRFVEQMPVEPGWAAGLLAYKSRQLAASQQAAAASERLVQSLKVGLAEAQAELDEARAQLAQLSVKQPRRRRRAG